MRGRSDIFVISFLDDVMFIILPKNTLNGQKNRNEHLFCTHVSPVPNISVVPQLVFGLMLPVGEKINVPEHTWMYLTAENVYANADYQNVHTRADKVYTESIHILPVKSWEKGSELRRATSP